MSTVSAKNPDGIILDHQVNLLTSGCRFEGTLELETYSHFNGQIKGLIRSREESTVVIGENGVVEGEIQGDTVIVDGFVRGEIIATRKVIISETGRVVGAVRTPNFSVKFGGYFEGRCTMDLEKPAVAAGRGAKAATAP